jgi:hypothetical protein
MCENPVSLVEKAVARWQDVAVKKPTGRQPVALITEAELSPGDQLRSRQRRYLAMMGTRVVCLIGSAVAYSVHAMWAIPILIAGMVALPWMAVLIANDRPPLKPSRFSRRVVTLPPDRAIEGPVPVRVIDQ